MKLAPWSHVLPAQAVLVVAVATVVVAVKAAVAATVVAVAKVVAAVSVAPTAAAVLAAVVVKAAAVVATAVAAVVSVAATATNRPASLQIKRLPSREPFLFLLFVLARLYHASNAPLDFHGASQVIKAHAVARESIARTANHHDWQMRLDLFGIGKEV